MTSPVTVGTIPVIVAIKNRNRNSIRFQNVGLTTINMKKILPFGDTEPVSISDFEIQLFGSATSLEGGEAFITNSTAGFMAISSAADGALAIFETIKA